MKNYELEKYLDQQISALENELKRLKRARRTRRAKTESSIRFGGNPALG